ncbi:MAG TPA: HD domain-containing protein, partial [Planctomycetes bacterium]|nr:HD domain-containing protein [Planctomycetota bacterium]
EAPPLTRYNGTMSSNRLRIRDAVHGDITLTEEEGRLLDTPQMQRLRGVHQLGLAYLVFPGARHSRFEHSIGTLHMTQVLIDAIQENALWEGGRGLQPEVVRILRAAALVHDVTHIPFGHNIEDQSGLLERHDSPARFQTVLSDETALGRELARQGIREEVLSVLGAGEEVEEPYLQQMISDSICPDLMDYLRRDAYYTGLDLQYDQRVAEYFRVDEKGRLFVDCAKEGLLREDVVSEILRMLQARYFFSERVYYHHAKVAAGAMIARAVEDLLEEGRLRPEELQGTTDEGLRLLLRERGKGERTRSLLGRLETRRLYKRVAVFPYQKNAEVQERLIAELFAPGARERRVAFERAREEEFRGRFGKDVEVLLYCPSRRMQLKECETLVRFPNEELRSLSSYREELPRVRDLEDSYLRLWKVYVLSSATEREERKFLQERVGEALPYARDSYLIQSG